MPPADYNKLIKEWTTVGEYRAELGITPSAKLITWAGNHGLDYARLIPKNTEVRKIAGVAAQVKYCNDKAAEATAKLNGVEPPPVVVEPAAIKHAANCKCKTCKPTNNIVAPPIVALEAALPADFSGIIKSMSDIYNKLAADLKAANNKIKNLEQMVYSAELEAHRWESEFDKSQLAMRGLELEIEQRNILKPTLPVCDVCQLPCNDGFKKCDYEVDGIDICCDKCWDETYNTPEQTTQQIKDKLTSAEEEEEEEENCKCGNNTEFDSDLIYGDVYCFACEMKVCEDCTWLEYPDMYNVMCKECAIQGGYKKESVVESTDDESTAESTVKSTVESTDESTDSYDDL